MKKYILNKTINLMNNKIIKHQKLNSEQLNKKNDIKNLINKNIKISYNNKNYNQKIFNNNYSNTNKNIKIKEISFENNFKKLFTINSFFSKNQSSLDNIYVFSLKKNKKKIIKTNNNSFNKNNKNIHDYKSKSQMKNIENSTLSLRQIDSNNNLSNRKSNEIIKKIFYKKAIISKPINNLSNQKNSINNNKIKIKNIIKKDNNEIFDEKKENLKIIKNIKENVSRNKKNLKSNSNNLISIKQMIIINNNKMNQFSISETQLQKLKTTMSQNNILNKSKKEKIINNLKIRQQKINYKKEKKNNSISNIEKSIDKVNKIVDYNTKYIINNPNLKIQTEKDFIIDLESSINKEMDERINLVNFDNKNDIQRNNNLINKVFEFHTWNSKKNYDNYNNSSLTNYKTISKVKKNIINTDYSTVNSKLTIKKNNYKNNMKNLIKKNLFFNKEILKINQDLKNKTNNNNKQNYNYFTNNNKINKNINSKKYSNNNSYLSPKNLDKSILFNITNNEEESDTSDFIINDDDEYLKKEYKKKTEKLNSSSSSEEILDEKKDITIHKYNIFNSNKNIQFQNTYQINDIDIIEFLNFFNINNLNNIIDIKLKIFKSIISYLNLFEINYICLKYKNFHKIIKYYIYKIIEINVIKNNTKRHLIKNIIKKYSTLKNEKKETIQKIYYENLANKNVLHENEINKDLPRTFPNDQSFKKDEKNYVKLYQLLIAYSNYNKNIEYAQGLNFIAGNIIFLFNGSEDRFLFLDGLIQRFNLENLLGKNNKLNIKMEEIGKILNKYCKEIIDYFDKNYLSHEFFTSNWVITLFSSSMINKYLFIVWDYMIIFGWKFFNAFVISVLNKYKKIILNKQQNDLAIFMKNILKTKQFEIDFIELINNSMELISKEQNLI